MKKASAILDGNSTIHRLRRVYYAHLSSTSSAPAAAASANMISGASSATSTAVGPAQQMEHTFGRPMVVAKLGQFIMDIKVLLRLMMM